LLDALKEER